MKDDQLEKLKRKRNPEKVNFSSDIFNELLMSKAIYYVVAKIKCILLNFHNKSFSGHMRFLGVIYSSW